MRALLLLLTLLFFAHRSGAQYFPSATDTFSGGTFTANQNQVLYVSNQTAPGNLIRLGAAATIVFDGAYTGQLQIVGFPTVYTRPGSNVQISNGIPDPWQPTSNLIQPIIYNYGQLQARSLLAGNLSYTFNFGLLVLDSLNFEDMATYTAPPGKVYNFGAIQAGYTHLASDSLSYLGFAGSSLVTGTLVIDTANAVVGPTCVKITDQLVVHAPLTNTANVSIILNNTTAVSNPGNIPLGGTMAPANINCDQLGTPLPMTIRYFEVRGEGTYAVADWSAEGQTRLQYSVNGRDYQDINLMNSGKYRQPLAGGTNYFRLAVLNGADWQYSRTVVLKFSENMPLPISFYDLNGTRLAEEPRSGFYIRRQGSVAVKLMKY